LEAEIQKLLTVQGGIPDDSKLKELQDSLDKSQREAAEIKASKLPVDVQEEFKKLHQDLENAKK